MRTLEVPIPEIGFIAATRGIGGAGLGLLLASRIRPRKRRAYGWRLLAIGALTTIPIVVDLVSRARKSTRY